MRVLTGLATVGIVVIWSAGATDAGEKKVKIKVPEDCGKATISGSNKAKKKDDDVLLFRFSNACNTPQTVYLCAVPADSSGPTTPWYECLGLKPEQPMPGTPFEIAAGSSSDPTTAYALCSVAYPSGTTKKFCLYVDSTAAGTTPTCPPPGKTCTSRGSEIAIEVEP